jgi:hypothetical protein
LDKQRVGCYVSRCFFLFPETAFLQNCKGKRRNNVAASRFGSAVCLNIVFGEGVRMEKARFCSNAKDTWTICISAKIIILFASHFDPFSDFHLPSIFPCLSEWNLLL